MDSNGVNMDKVKDRFATICPGKDLEKIMEDHAKRSLVEKDGIIARNNPSLKNTFEQRFEKKKEREFIGKNNPSRKKQEEDMER